MVGCTVIVDGFFGDGGKGKIISYLAVKDRLSICARAGGGPNAGHTVVREGKVYKLRMVPSAFTYEKCRLLIGPGVVINPEVLLREVGVDGFGVGTWISNAPTVDFAMDIVEVEGRPAAKRGKLGGRKQVWRCENCFNDLVQPASSRPPSCPKCGGEMRPLLQPLIRDGEIVADLPDPGEIRCWVLEQLKRVG